jgi:hypothetical protein
VGREWDKCAWYTARSLTPRHLTSRALASALVLVSCAGIVRASAPRSDLASPPGAVGRAALPGGVEGIRRALEDRVAMTPDVVGVEIARRVHGGTEETARRHGGWRRLEAWLRLCETTAACDAAPLHADEIPLPGPPAFWLDTVFEGRVRPEHLTLAIFGNRRASLLYAAMLAMDDATRAWLIERPDLVRRLSETDGGALVVASPYLRIEHGRWRLPGGSAVEAIWMDLVAARLEDSPGFFLAMLCAHGGLVTYMLEVVSTLDAAQQASALALGSAQAPARLAAGRVLFEALGDAAKLWRPGERPFWRPAVDPVFLLQRLRIDTAGRPAVPGGRKLWELALESGGVTPPDDRAVEAWRDTEPVSAAWLVARVASASPLEQATRNAQVLFASRWLADATVSEARDVVTVIRGYSRYPQLLRTLERMGVTDVRRLAAMARQAEALSSAGQDWRAQAVVVQWQSVITLLERAARADAITDEALREAIDALSTRPPAGAGPGSDAVWLSWLTASLPAPPGGAGVRADVGIRSLERALIARVTGSATATARRVSWEDTTYRLDFAAAERDRITRVRGRDNRPLLDGAATVLALARHRATPGEASRSAKDDLATLAEVSAAAGLDRPRALDDELGRVAREAAAQARRHLAADGARPSSIAARTALADLSEAMATSALFELVYAASMGWAEDLPLSAAAAARRHEFVRDVVGDRRDLFWTPPVIVTDAREPWHVAGSLLGLDVGLGPVALRRLSARPLGAPPLLNTGDRAALVATAVVLDRRDFTDEAQRAVATLVARARQRLGAVRGAADARAVAVAAGASSVRQTLAVWRAEAAPATLATFFSLTELVRLGLDGAPWPDSLRGGWGNYDVMLGGQLKAGALTALLPMERFAGRSGRTLSCGVPDLQLSLALGLAELELPAALVPDLMASATFDLINHVPSRYADDWQAIVDQVRTVDRPAVERHLGLLTTSGPLRADSGPTTH